MHSFIKLVLKLGIDKHAISSSSRDADGNMKTTALLDAYPSGGKKHFAPFLLFDWEFFSNELEFE
ncbi:hypothetical protein FLA_4084 [Filimonas lacunae]|nr:hypothetical protein FLA_4084 [Filimonas lacunae]